MILAAVTNPFIQFPGGAKFTIGWIALFHTAVASLSIGFAFVVTILQIAGYTRRENRFDLLAKRVQLWHVCIYNIGTINAIGLVFALSGLYPQFWSQAFTQFFWTLIIEEALFFMLATTLTLHYFFWDTLWGHKKLHIFLGGMLTPFFFLQVFAIHGIGSYILTPGFAEGQVSLWSGTAGILGWDRFAFYNPSFLMLTVHRTFANFAYGGFFVAGICGILLFLSQKSERQSLYEIGGRLTFHMAFASLLLLPIAGFFYAWVLKYHAKAAYDNLMIGRGDIVAGGIDWWWTKQLIVASMLGIGLAFARKSAKAKSEFSLPMLMVYSLAFVYLVFYIGMGMQMTWRFFWGSLGAAILAGLIGTHLVNRHEGSGRAVFLLMGLLSFLTVCLGGYVREAARPRFVTPTGERVAGFNRIPDYSELYHPNERPELMTIQMVRDRPDYVDELPGHLFRPDPDRWTAADLVSYRCISCHTLERVHRYQADDWERVVGRMRAYGMRMTQEEMRRVIDYLKGDEDGGRKTDG
jgi:hypothetical protein